MDSQSEPLIRTDTANAWLSVGLVITGLVLLVFGNNDMAKPWKFAGSDVSDTANAVGVAILIAAITQYYTDFRVRSKFYLDVSDHIVANETLRESGIVKFFRDSKSCLPSKLIEASKSLDVGVTYSDRVLKDNIGSITKKAGVIKVRIFCSDGDNADVKNAISFNTGLTNEEIDSEYRKLTRIVEELKRNGVDVEIHKQLSIPHYSFYVIDESYYFLTMSTFASRRATVPLFQADKSSPLAGLIREDITNIIALDPQLVSEDKNG